MHHKRKKMLRLLLTAAILCAVMATSAFAVKVTAIKNVNVRAKATSSSSIKTVMKKGMSRTVLGTSSSGKWVKVKVNAKTGYVNKNYLTEGSSTSSSATVTYPVISPSKYSFDLQTNYPGVAYRDKNGKPAGATIASGGCCPTSVGNILRNLCGISEATTRNVCTLATSSGARYNGGTTAGTLLKAAQKKWGGFTYKYTTSASTMRAHVKAGGMAIAHTIGASSGSRSLFSNGGHFVAIVGMSGTKMVVADPYYYAGKWTANSVRRANVTTTSAKGKVNVKSTAVAAACNYYYLVSRE
ncbi:MAG: SH3 domain-containing protein [Eubacteriales bacterium]|nr:SH3 domain-containing protein [Eubacteriales bacterium]